jgi:hypothetical protein
MSKTFSFQLSGPSFIGLYVRDVKASGEFYEKKWDSNAIHSASQTPSNSAHTQSRSQ